MPAMASLVLGPLLRYVGRTEATIWVETDGPCEVEVLGRKARTFCVEGHHYGLVVIEELEPGSSQEYEVALDGERAWPPPDWSFPPSVLRTFGEREQIELVFGSCRLSLPHEPPYTLPKETDEENGRGFDALHALARSLLEADAPSYPDLLFLCGDQVYADQVSPKTLEFIRQRDDRPRDAPPDEVADFEEFTRLYREAWSDPVIRWLLSTVSSSMVIDDHDMHDDWNISQGLVRGDGAPAVVAREDRRRDDGLLAVPVHRQPLPARARRAPRSGTGCRPPTTLGPSCAPSWPRTTRSERASAGASTATSARRG